MLNWLGVGLRCARGCFVARSDWCVYSCPKFSVCSPPPWPARVWNLLFFTARIEILPAKLFLCSGVYKNHLIRFKAEPKKCLETCQQNHHRQDMVSWSENFLPSGSLNEAEDSLDFWTSIIILSTINWIRMFFLYIMWFIYLFIFSYTPLNLASIIDYKHEFVFK